MAVRWRGRRVDSPRVTTLLRVWGPQTEHDHLSWWPTKEKLQLGTRMAAWAQHPAPTAGLQTQVSRNPSPCLTLCLSAHILSCPGASSHPMECCGAEEWCLPESLPPQAHAVTGSWKSLSCSPFSLRHSYFMIELNSENSSWFNLRTAVELTTMWLELKGRGREEKNTLLRPIGPAKWYKRCLRLSGRSYNLSVKGLSASIWAW